MPTGASRWERSPYVVRWSQAAEKGIQSRIRKSQKNYLFFLIETAQEKSFWKRSLKNNQTYIVSLSYALYVAIIRIPNDRIWCMDQSAPTNIMGKWDQPVSLYLGLYVSINHFERTFKRSKSCADTGRLAHAFESSRESIQNIPQNAVSLGPRALATDSMQTSVTLHLNRIWLIFTPK